MCTVLITAVMQTWTVDTSSTVTMWTVLITAVMQTWTVDTSSAVTICQILFAINKRYDKLNQIIVITIWYDNSIMITIGRISHFVAAVVTRATHTRVCCIGLLSAACPCGAATSKYSPSSRRLRTTDVYQSCAKCESRNFESIFRPPAIFHPRTCPCPQLHVSPSHRLRHLTVTKRTVT